MSDHPGLSQGIGGALKAFALLALTCLLVLTPLPAEERKESTQTSPTAAPLQAARVLAGEGYERRALLAGTTLAAGKSASLGVYLFPQNDYCFLLAGHEGADGLTFAIFDAVGDIVEESSYRHGDNALHFIYLQPRSTGRHYLRIVNEGGSPVRLALTYCYR